MNELTPKERLARESINLASSSFLTAWFVLQLFAPVNTAEAHESAVSAAASVFLIGAIVVAIALTAAQATIVYKEYKLCQ